MKLKVLLILPLLVASLQAASVSDLTFTLNDSGAGYSVTDCDDSASGSLIIPSSYNGLPVTGINNQALSECSLLTNITIPDSITTIGWDAFYGCTGITSITVPNSVISIGETAFFESGLTSLNIPYRFTPFLRHIGVPDSIVSEVFFSGIEQHLNNSETFTGSSSSDSVESVSWTVSIDQSHTIRQVSDLGHLLTYKTDSNLLEYTIYNRDGIVIFNQDNQLQPTGVFISQATDDDGNPVGNPNYIHKKPRFVGGTLVAYSGTTYNNMKTLVYAYRGNNYVIADIINGVYEPLYDVNTYDNEYTVLTDRAGLVYVFGSNSGGGSGPQGLQGQKGDTGDVGPKGDTGDVGPKGDTGDIGPEGPKGDTGDAGPQGPAGLDSSAIQTLRASEPHIETNSDGKFDVTYSVESSENLSDWSTELNLNTTIDPNDSSKQFLRLRVE